MQRTVGAGRIPVDLENGHDSLTRVFPFTGRVPRSRNCQAALIHTREISMALLLSPLLSSLLAPPLPSPLHLPPLRPKQQPCNLRRYRFPFRASILALYYAFFPPP